MKFNLNLSAFLAVGALCYNAPVFSAPIHTGRTLSPVQIVPSPPQSVVAPAHAKIVVTADAVSLPLADALRQISSGLPIELSASRDIADQRVTLCAKEQALEPFMAGVAETLSHTSKNATGYIWEAGPSAAGKSSYRLKRTSAGRIAERQGLEKPRQEALQGLYDLRNAAHRAEVAAQKTNPTEHEKLVIEYGKDRYVQAFKALNDSQIKRLLNGEVLSVPTTPFQDANLPSPIVIRVFNAAEKEHDPTKSDWFGVCLANFTPTAWRGLNSARGREKTGYLPETPDADKETAPVYDLNPLLSAPGVTDEQRTDLGFVVHTLSQVTGIPVYEEHFIRQVGLFYPDVKGLTLRKGTMPQLVNAICKHWEYQVEQAPSGDLLFWSRHWAQDKQSDISERTLAPWRSVLQKQGRFTETDYTDMAQKLSFAQVRVTLPYAFGVGEHAPWMKDSAQTDTDWDRFTNTWGVYQYKGRRLTAALTPGEQQAAQSPDGIAFGDLSMGTQRKILGEITFATEAQWAARRKGDYAFPGPTRQQIAQSRVFCYATTTESGRVPLSVNIKGEGDLRWE